MESTSVTNEEELEWAKIRQQPFIDMEEGRFNYLEITRLPKKIDGRLLASLIISASKIVPVSTDICIRRVGPNALDQVALVEFKSESDASKAANKIKMSAFGRSWEIRFVRDPKMQDLDTQFLNPTMRY